MVVRTRSERGGTGRREKEKNGGERLRAMEREGGSVFWSSVGLKVWT